MLKPSKDDPRKVHLTQELLLFSYSSVHLTSMEESPEANTYVSSLQHSEGVRGSKRSSRRV